MNTTMLKVCGASGVRLGAALAMAALAACGGGGADAGVTANPVPVALASTNSPNDDQIGLLGNNAPQVPNANLVLNTVPTSTYTGQALLAWSSLQDWRGRLRTTDQGPRGVGYVTQSAALDQVAATLASVPAQRAQASTLMAAAGYPVGVYATAAVTGSTIPAGALCAKRLFSALPGVEVLSAGLREVGIAVPSDNTGECAVVAGLPAVAAWQLPPTGSTAVYPFPGKVMTLTSYGGDPTALGMPADAQPGHVVWVSVASVDALPTDISGAGSGVAIAPARITLEALTLRVKATNVEVPALRLVYPGVVLAPGVSAQTSTALRFPTSMVLVPWQRLPSGTVLAASFRATVNGRVLYRNWEFTTAE